MVRAGDFCSFVNDNCKDDGFPHGTVCWIAGVKALPESKDDPYLQRIYALVHAVKDDKTVDVSAGFFMVNPNNIEKIEDAEEYEKLLMEKFDNATTH